jgi:hypothetical protein
MINHDQIIIDLNVIDNAFKDDMAQKKWQHN